ncbi:MAG: leucine-rich repeat domain-containing protein [Lachnospiraceae bacterium]|nr:leucine-rich repeat domain-containing protein [Lachnospiraceae bacterium]
MIEMDFENLLSSYGDAVGDRIRFAGLVKDYFPEQKMQSHLILSAYDLGIADDIRFTEKLDDAFAYRFVRRMVDEYGISRVNAEWAVNLWCICYGKKTLGKECSLKALSRQSSRDARSEAGDKPGVVTYGDLFRYTRSSNGKGLAVSGFVGENRKTIIFQNFSDGKPVLEIMDGAFSESDMEEAIFTEGIRKIGNRAFLGCSSLTQVIFPESMRELGMSAFAGCSNLSLAALPPLLEKLGDYSLSGTRLRSISIPQSTYWIGEGAFSNCGCISSIAFPNSVDELPDKICSGCTGLKKVTLHGQIRRIGSEAFFGCCNLEDIYVPKSVQDIGDEAFAQTHEKFLLMCDSGSYAEAYARKNRLKYQLV